MKIGLHDSEKEYLKRKTFPNYALMKISAYHKSIGDTVEWWNPLEKYDKVYSSKIFDFTPYNPYLPPDTIKGGTGYDIHSVLPDEIDRCFPDYSIYPECDYAIGYITRGCPNNCRWCIVPQKEGNIQPYRTWQELVRADSNKLVLMDNNILSCEYGIKQLESLIDSGYQIDLNQGMDARLVNDRIAAILSRIKWVKYIRFSCDTTAQIKAIETAAELLLNHGIKPYKLFIYLLVTADVENAAYRVERLRKLKGITIYAQAERNERKGIIPNKLQLEFAQRYVYSGKYRKETWQEYCVKRSINRDSSIKWDGQEYANAIRYGFKVLLTDMERQKAKKLNNADFAEFFRRLHKGIEQRLCYDKNTRYTLKCDLDKIIFDFGDKKIYLTWSMAARHIKCWVMEENENKQEVHMGKIDFTAMKNSRKAIEDKVEDNIPTGLEESYSGVWGSKEKITTVEISRLKPYMDSNGGQPYKINPKKVEQIAASAMDIGIITPLRVRPKGDIYEVICGHHRLEAAKSLNQISVPCIIKDYSDEEVFRILSESNIQRDRTLPSEYGKIFARYMGLRNDDETTAEEIAVKFDVSRKTMYRYLDVNRLIPELQEMTDTGIINIGAVEYIAKLDTDVQNALYQALDKAKVKLSAALAKRVRSLVDDFKGDVTADSIFFTLTNKSEKKSSSTVYENIRQKYNVDIPDKELDELIAQLLDKHFQSVSQ